MANNRFLNIFIILYYFTFKNIKKKFRRRWTHAGLMDSLRKDSVSDSLQSESDMSPSPRILPTTIENISITNNDIPDIN